MIRGSGRRTGFSEPPERPKEAPLGRVLSRVTRVPTFRSLRFQDFRYLWAAQISNSLGVWIEVVARPLMILDMAGPGEGAVHLGLVLATRTIPQFIFGLVGGVFADWFDRRKLLVIAMSCAALLDFGLAILLLTGLIEMWHVYVTAFLKGVASSFDQPARQSLIPSLVDDEDMSNAIALNSASMNAMRILGSSLAGFLKAGFGIGITFLVISLLGGIAVLYTLRMRSAPIALVRSGGEKGTRGAVSSLAEGLQYVWRVRPIRELLILLLGFFGLATSYMSVFAPLLAKQTMGIGDQGFGFMMSMAGVGALIGALAVATLSPFRRRGAILLVLLALDGAFLTFYAASTYSSYVFLTFVLFAFVGAAQTSTMAVGNTIVLQASDPAKRGRVMGIMSLDRSMFTLGSTIAGLLAAAIGAQVAQMSFGIGLILFALAGALLFTHLRRID